MLSGIYAECREKVIHDECRYAECCYAECHYALGRGAIQLTQRLQPSTV